MALATLRGTTAFGEIATLARSWERALRPENNSPRPITAYLEGVRLLRQYLERMALPTEVEHITSARCRDRSYGEMRRLEAASSRA